MDNCDMLDVSVAIVNWNTREMLYDCLMSIQSLAANPLAEVIVVDNNSSDGSPEMVLERFPWVDLICNEANLGFAAACNRAIEKSLGRYLLFLNSDTVVLGDAVCQLVREMDKRGDVGVMGCRLENPDGSLQPSVYNFINPWRVALEKSGIGRWGLFRRIYDPQVLITDWSYDELREVDYVRGACMIVRRRVLEEIGGFDTQFFMYAEEADLCFRAAQAGWKVMFFPGATVLHHGGASAKQSTSTRQQRETSRFLFMQKRYGRLIARAYFFGSRRRRRLGEMLSGLAAKWRRGDGSG